jgi:hypothetical protein
MNSVLPPLSAVELIVATPLSLPPLVVSRPTRKPVSSVAPAASIRIAPLLVAAPATVDDASSGDEPVIAEFVTLTAWLCVVPARTMPKSTTLGEFTVAVPGNATAYCMVRVMFGRVAPKP